MKIAIVGCGAMGSVYAALLADAGHDVWAVDSWKEHVDAMRSKGLRLEGASGDRTVALHASTDAAEVGPCDLVIIATKAMHVEQAATASKALVGDNTMVLSIQNGLGGPDTTARILGKQRVMVGVVGGLAHRCVAPAMPITTAGNWCGWANSPARSRRGWNRLPRSGARAASG